MKHIRKRVFLLGVILQLTFGLFDQTSIAYATDYCVFPTIPDEIDNPLPKVKWDENNPDEINRTTENPDGCVTICVLDGVAPFTWTVSGENFYFNFGSGVTKITTDERCVNLCGSNNSCGSAIIKVKDAFNDVTTGALRDPENGTWTNWIYDFFGSGNISGVCEVSTGDAIYQALWFGCQVDCDYVGFGHQQWLENKEKYGCIPDDPGCTWIEVLQSWKRYKCIVYLRYKKYICN